MQFLSGMCCLLCCLLTAFPAFAASVEDRVRQLEEIVQSQSRIIKEQQEILDRLQQQQTASVPTPPAVTAPQAAVAAPPAPKAETAKASGGLFGSSFMSNPNISLVVDTNAYASNLSNSELANRSIPGFTTQGLENKNNFNLEAAELFLFAPVDHTSTSTPPSRPTRRARPSRRPMPSQRLCPGASRPRAASSRATSAASTASIPTRGISPTSHCLTGLSWAPRASGARRASS
jgi:hypothetical protein